MFGLNHSIVKSTAIYFEDCFDQTIADSHGLS